MVVLGDLREGMLLLLPGDFNRCLIKWLLHQSLILSINRSKDLSEDMGETRVALIFEERVLSHKHGLGL